MNLAIFFSDKRNFVITILSITLFYIFICDSSLEETFSSKTFESAENFGAQEEGEKFEKLNGENKKVL